MTRIKLIRKAKPFTAEDTKDHRGRATSQHGGAEKSKEAKC